VVAWLSGDVIRHISDRNYCGVIMNGVLLCVSGVVYLATAGSGLVVLQSTQVDGAQEQKDHLQTSATLTCRSS